MSVGSPKDESVTALLQEVGKTLQDNQRFLAALRQDQAVEDDLAAGELDAAADGEFEEL
ncbi:MAG: hypothetical protein WBI04_03185 [Trichlorobacter sp.]|jgi:hypothetical protein